MKRARNGVEMSLVSTRKTWSRAYHVAMAHAGRNGFVHWVEKMYVRGRGNVWTIWKTDVRHKWSQE